MTRRSHAGAGSIRLLASPRTDANWHRRDSANPFTPTIELTTYAILRFSPGYLPEGRLDRDLLCLQIVEQVSRCLLV